MRTYDLGVNSFITKPVTFDALVEVMQTWSRYWFEIVDLPPDAEDQVTSAGSTVRVLLVEDDEDDYLIARDLLEMQDRTRFELDWCPTYEEALTAISERRHDVYLIDYRLGSETGTGLIRDAFDDEPAARDHAHRAEGLPRHRPRGGRGGGDRLPLEGPDGRRALGALDPLLDQPPPRADRAQGEPAAFRACGRGRP